VTALKQIVTILETAKVFWEMMAAARKRVASPTVRQDIDLFKDDPPEERLKEYARDEFKLSLLQLAWRWCALKVIADEYRVAVAKAREEVVARSTRRLRLRMRKNSRRPRRKACARHQQGNASHRRRHGAAQAEQALLRRSARCSVKGGPAMLVARNPAFRLPRSGAWFSARRWAAGWRGFGFVVAIAFSALASQASAASDEAARTRAALEAFARAAAALEHGDRATAAQDLDGMAASISSLREVAARYSGLAQTMGSACQARSVAVIDQIQTTNQQEQQKQDELAQLQARSENLQAQAQQLQSDIAGVNAKRQPLIEKAKYRNAARRSRALVRGGQSMLGAERPRPVNNRYQHVNDELADLQRQQQILLQVRGDLAQERARLQTEADQARNRRPSSRQRRRLELDRATRAAATTSIKH
jgi:hypothetical protein